jgi:DNA recombination-dependent growth factor C
MRNTYNIYQAIKLVKDELRALEPDECEKNIPVIVLPLTWPSILSFYLVPPNDEVSIRLLQFHDQLRRTNAGLGLLQRVLDVL